ncbi:MAG: hypothetical protein VX916_01640 [Planctomycetota bacterium]|nr:hypothetical protein [Planctomycetota bacterium]
MATTASLLESYLVDLTHASEEQGDEHTTQTTTIIAACMEILLISEDDPYAENGCIIDGDELTKTIGRRSQKLLQRKLRTHTLIWIGITITTAIWALTIGLAI